MRKQNWKRAQQNSCSKNVVKYMHGIYCCEWLLWLLDYRKAARLEDDEYKTPNQTYYNIAHSSSERIMQQPGLLVGGTLKEYQVSTVHVHCTMCC